jgi:hypothetical protein
MISKAKNTTATRAISSTQSSQSISATPRLRR